MLTYPTGMGQHSGYLSPPHLSTLLILQYCSQLHHGKMFNFSSIYYYPHFLSPSTFSVTVLNSETVSCLSTAVVFTMMAPSWSACKHSHPLSDTVTVHYSVTTLNIETNLALVTSLVYLDDLRRVSVGL